MKTLTPLMIAACLLVAGSASASRNIDAYLMAPDEELALAATAGPKSITEGASYYLLHRHGFELARQGSNGWYCFVERAWFRAVDGSTDYDPRVRAPHCINDEGSQTRMRELFMISRLAIEGHTKEDVDRIINAAYASGDLRPPRRLVLTYMMSRHQWLGEKVGNWYPHVMLWLPYLDTESIGTNDLMSGHPVIGNGAGTRDSILIIPVTEFID